MAKLDVFVQKKTTISIGGKSWIFSELTLADIAAFKACLKEQRDKANNARRMRLLKDAKEVSNLDPVELLRLVDTSISDDDFEKESETIEGIGHLAHLSLKHHHPELTLVDTLNMITTNLIEAITEAMFPSLAEPNKKKVTSRSKE
ncbi:hypothetical protein LCGC14_0930970 [marine sediment metagenome]|uniref:Uncharacterized protein n=1 Tax=marine sediment metagenome TaxID=412755 RepID=A0A0F9RUJ2_9ZZZZ